MKNILSSIKVFNINDLTVIAFYIFLTVLNIVFHARIEEWFICVLINFGVISFVISVAWLEKNSNKSFWKYIHYWYLAPLILLTFKEIYLMIKPIRVNDFDNILIQADRFLLGFDPTVELAKIANPLLTEILQISYGTFYLLPIILGVSLMINKKYLALDFSLFCVVYGFFLSYVGYFLLPAIGPRFTLHDFHNINNELPGLFLTNFLREIVNMGESIPAGTPNPELVVQRDVFPSGHTQMTLITMYLSWKFNSKTKYFLIPNGTLLIFATVYLRYHYVIDLIGGLLFMVFTIWSGKYLFFKWKRFTSEPEEPAKINHIYQLAE